MVMSSIKREATSIKMDRRIWKEAKIEAIKQDMELSELVEKAVEAWINKQNGKGGSK